MFCLSVTQMLHDLGWRDLSDRRQDLRQALLNKVVTGHVTVGPDQIGLVAADNRTRANHRFKFGKCDYQSGPDWCKSLLPVRACGRHAGRRGHWQPFSGQCPRLPLKNETGTNPYY